MQTMRPPCRQSPRKQPEPEPRETNDKLETLTLESDDEQYEFAGRDAAGRLTLSESHPSSIFSPPPTTAKSRSSSPSKSMAHLGLVEKPIRQRNTESAAELPADVRQLWEDMDLIRLNEGTVPRQIEPNFIAAYPSKTRPYMFFDAGPGANLAQLQAQLVELEEIKQATQDFRTTPASEASWNCDVHSRIIRLAVKSIPGIAQENVTAVRPDRALVPRDRHGGNMDSRLVGYVLLADHSLIDLHCAERCLNRTVPSINHTLDPCPRLLTKPIVVSIETKTPSSDESEAMVQLSLWAATHFNRLRTLLAPAQQKSGTVGITLPLLIVPGDIWRLYFAVDREDCIEILGGLKIGSTDTLLGCYQVLRGLVRVCEWARDGYVPWFRKNVLGECDAVT